MDIQASPESSRNPQAPGPARGPRYLHALAPPESNITITPALTMLRPREASPSLTPTLLLPNYVDLYTIADRRYAELSAQGHTTSMEAESRQGGAIRNAEGKLRTAAIVENLH